MKILHVVPTYYPSWIYGGPILSVHNLCYEQIRKGHDVYVATTNVNGKKNLKRKPGKIYFVNGVKVIYFPTLIRRIYFSPEIKNFFEKKISEFDIVHLHSIFLYPTYIAAKFCRQKKIPYIICPRGMLIKKLFFMRNLIPKIIWYIFLEKKNLLNAKYIHATTEYEKKEIEKFGFHSKQIKTIPNGLINFNLFNFKKEKKINIFKDKKNILYIGRINHKKNLELPIKAMQLLPNYHLYIIGNNENYYLEELKQLVTKINLKNVTFHRPIRGVAKEDMLKKCDLFILTSYSENFGNSVLDALKYKKVVAVTSDVGIAKDIKKYDCGYILPNNHVKFAKKIRSIFSNKKKIKKTKNNIPKLLKEKYSWKKIINSLDEIYKSEKK